MDLFKNYQREFEATIGAIKRKLEQLPKYTGEQRKTFLREINGDFDTAKELVDNLKHTANGLRGGDQLKSTIKMHERELETYREDFKRAQLGASFSREVKTPSQYSDWGAAEADQRTRLLTDRDRLGQTSNRIADIHSMASETEKIGTDTLVDLKLQGEKLQRASSGMDDIEDTTSKARKILSMMKRRVITNKLVLIFIILILFAAICIVVWVRWIGPMIARRQGAPAAPPMGPAPVALPVAPPPPHA